MKSRFRRFRSSCRLLFTSLLVGALFAGMLAAPARAATVTELEFLDRAIELSSIWRDGATITGISSPFVGTFTAGDGPHAGEAVDTAGWTVSDTEGAYSVVVLFYEQPWISSFQGDATGSYVGGSWELASQDPNAAVTQGSDEMSVVAANSLACAIGAGAVSGGTGTVACLPFGPLGAVICGTLGGAGGGAAGYFACQDPTNPEGIQTDMSCFYADKCEVKLTVKSFNQRAASVNTTAYWDLKGQTGTAIGSVPCRPACGDHSITSHSSSSRQLLSTTYLPDPNDPLRNRPLYEYRFTFTIVGLPTCFVYNTVAVWGFFTVNLENTTRKLWNDVGATKNSFYCAY